MENAADALKMAGSVLLFVIALSVAVLAFSQARIAIDAVLKFSDRESLKIEDDDRFYYLSSSSNTNRYVGKETIIPAIYRAYKENYKIIFEFPDNYYLFRDKNGQEVKKIDLVNQSLASDLESRQFLDGIIYGKYDYDTGKLKNDFIRRFNITPNDKSFFKYLTDSESKYNIKEELGTYYIEDLASDSTDTDRDQSIQKVEEVNKSEKRVITYIFETE